MKIIKIFFIFVVFISLSGCASKRYEPLHQNVATTQQNPTYEVIKSDNITLQSQHDSQRKEDIKRSNEDKFLDFFYITIYGLWLYHLFFK